MGCVAVAAIGRRLSLLLVAACVFAALAGDGNAVRLRHLLLVFGPLQTRKEILLYAAASGSKDLVARLLDEFHVPINSVILPGVCLDCDPVCLKSQCTHGHGVGMETALMSAALSDQAEIAEMLCSRGASVNVQNEVGVEMFRGRYK